MGIYREVSYAWVQRQEGGREEGLCGEYESLLDPGTWKGPPEHLVEMVGIGLPPRAL